MVTAQDLAKQGIGGRVADLAIGLAVGSDHIGVRGCLKEGADLCVERVDFARSGVSGVFAAQLGGIGKRGVMRHDRILLEHVEGIGSLAALLECDFQLRQQVER